MRNRFQLRGAAIHVARFGVVVSLLSSAYAQTCPGGPTQSGPGGSFCCSSTLNCCTPINNGTTGPVVDLEDSGDFVSNFVTSSGAMNHEVAFPAFQTGATGAGDLNARYSAIYYNINSSLDPQEQMANWMATCGGVSGGCNSVNPINPDTNQHYPSFCAPELVVAGDYPNARYFSISNYDEHYTIAQHVADYLIDPTNPQGTGSPYLPTAAWSPTTYVVPISLGAVPRTAPGSEGPVAGCQIIPYEEDNLLDGQQRHPDADWNSDVEGEPGMNFPGAIRVNGQWVWQSHILDDPGNNNTNPAGSIHVRAYLSPPYQCPSGPSSCTLPNASYFPADGTINTYIGTYFLVRDSYTGCAYTQDSVNNFMIAGQTQNGYNAPFLSKSRTTANWNDQAQMTLHTNASLAIPERCYANGFLAPSFSNSVAWTRTPEHVAGQAPDDAYVSGVISASELTNIMNATNCGATNLEACTLIQFTFKIPSMPGTPAMPSYNCQGHPGSCVLPGSQTALRYMSLTFGYQPGGQGSIIDDIDGENPTVTTDSTSLVSLADAAFNAAATFNSSTNVYPAQYVSLVVNVNPVLGGASLPIGLSYTPQGATTSTGYDVTSTAIMQGAGPVTTGSNNFTAWVNSFGSSYQPLVVLDLTQFEQFYSASCTGTPPNVQCTIPLVLTLRSTVLGPDPNNQMEPFTCSAFNVPYSTAAYTNADDLGGGFMGPYLPLASYPTVSSLLTPSPPLGSGSFPSEGSCTALSVNSPHPFPSGNLANISQLSQFPVQYFSNSAQAPPYLNCGNGSSTFLPEIYYAGTQFTVEAVASGEPGYVPPPSFSATSPCDYPDAASGGLNTNPCIQIIQQATENESTTAYQPPLPLTIIGKGFGYLSGLPQASGSPNYLTIQDNTAGWVTTSGACQVFILDWNDTLISVLLGLPPNHTVKNGEGQFLNPLADMSPASFFQGTSGTVGCAVKPGDSLTVTVANPQQPANTGSLAEPVIVGAYSTTTPY